MTKDQMRLSGYKRGNDGYWRRNVQFSDRKNMPKTLTRRDDGTLIRCRNVKDVT